MIKNVNFTYVSKDKILQYVIDKIELMYSEACELLKDRWVFMDNKKVYYDNEVVSLFPDLNFYKCTYIYNNYVVKNINEFKYEHKMAMNFENLNWDIMTYKEARKSFNRDINYPFKKDLYEIEFNENDRTSYIPYKDSRCYVFNVKIDNGETCLGGGFLLLPICRLNVEDSGILPDIKVFELWIKNKLIPKKSNYKDLYELIFYINENYGINFKDFKIVDAEKLVNDLKEEKFEIEYESQDIYKELLSCDKYRFDLDKYDEKILTDPNRGHWEIQLLPNNEKEIKINLDNDLVYRNPLKDVKEGGVVGIDFGTKSTVVVYQENSTDINLMRVGTGKLSKKVDKLQYENPTIMEFINLESFIKSYNSSNGRPKTKWKDLTVSHTAFEKLKEGSSSEEYYSYFNEIKQWCGSNDRRIRIKDKQGKIFDLPTFMEIGDDDFNPVEIYAYYLGLYINNMRNGIYLSYILSFPVTYEKETRDKIINSFEKGLKKSLPNEVLEDDETMKKFKVIAGANEPAAYAISALTEYGFDPIDDEKVLYGVFDFGGGTTDFDFGIFREANQKGERRYDYVIEHFNAGGDRYLGGENLLELLAFEVFKDNSESLREENISFILPPECKKFAGSEVLLSESQEARINTRKLMEELRPIWENHDNYEEKFNKGVINLNLYKNDGNLVTAFEIKVDLEKVLEILHNRIEKGIRNFFESLRLAFNESLTSDIGAVNILLAGNSSKSEIVKEIFNEYIKEEDERILSSLNKDELDEVAVDFSSFFDVFPPLGTEDAYKKQEALGIDFDNLDTKRPTGKTGVAFGLIEGRSGGKIKVVNKNQDCDGEAKFRYYVGYSKKKKFIPILTPDTGYDKFVELIDAFEKDFEIYYTTLPEAANKNLSISETTKINVTLDETFEDDDIFVYIKATSPSVIEYVVARELDSSIEIIKTYNKIQLD